MFKAIVFDIGGTLVEYNKPLNWSALYRTAWEHISKKCDYNLTENDFLYASNVLSKYNTRINPREYEVSSNQIFTEILSGIKMSMDDLEKVKHLFYSYFRREVSVYPEVKETLIALREKGILLGTLSDVAYGMDNQYVLDDIATIKQYIAYPYTSNDVGYRKPNVEGLHFLAKKMKVDTSEIIFVGDEEKDMICANAAGAYSVLINRDVILKEYGQQKEIGSMEELLEVIKKG